MTYNDVLKYLDDLYGMLGYDLGLDRMYALMAEMGNPQEKIKTIHVAGTNGKGSVTTMTATILQNAGYKVGMSISPYVVDFRERIQINGEMIPQDKLADITARVKAVVDELRQLLKSNGEDTSLADTIWQTYLSEKENTKAYYISTYGD